MDGVLGRKIDEIMKVLFCVNVLGDLKSDKCGNLYVINFFQNFFRF